MGQVVSLEQNGGTTLPSILHKNVPIYGTLWISSSIHHITLERESKVQVVEDHIENQQEVLQLLKDNLAITQNMMKQQAYQHHSERNLKWGLGISEATTIQTDVPQATKEGQ
jgi:hypothetical protein